MTVKELREALAPMPDAANVTMEVDGIGDEVRLVRALKIRRSAFDEHIVEVELRP